MKKKREFENETHEENTNATKSMLYNLWKTFSGGKQKHDQLEEEEIELGEEPEKEEATPPEEEKPKRRERVRERFPAKSPCWNFIRLGAGNISSMHPESLALRIFCWTKMRN